MNIYALIIHPLIGGCKQNPTPVTLQWKEIWTNNFASVHTVASEGKVLTDCLYKIQNSGTSRCYRSDVLVGWIHTSPRSDFTWKVMGRRYVKLRKELER